MVNHKNLFISEAQPNNSFQRDASIAFLSSLIYSSRVEWLRSARVNSSVRQPYLKGKMIERIIQRVMESTSPGTGDNLTGFEIDADHYFGSNEAFVNATLSRTEDLSCILEMRGEIANHISSLQQIGGVLNEIWQNLAYAHCEASSCQWYKEAMVFRFVTVISGDAFYVTGKMIVGGEHYSRLVERFENDFGRKLAQLSSAV